MNLQKLFEIQRILDEKIVKEKGLEGQDLLDKKVLALRVELFELLNELPEEFKFWSNKENNLERALEELIDSLHFILSIGNELGVSERIHVSKMYGMTKTKHVHEMISRLDEDAISLVDSHTYYKKSGKRYFDIGCYFNIVNRFFALTEMLGFTWEQIEQGYYEKNATITKDKKTATEVIL